VADRIEAFHFGSPGRRLFGVFHNTPDAPQAAVLMCPPLLHEYARSYRFFAGVAGLFSDAGLACLRFDYHGTGDADGDSDAFDPLRARDDIACAAEALRERTDGAPLILLGIRASAMLARACAWDIYASSLWLWQPVLDAKSYLDELEALDASERGSRLRYPFVHRGPPAEKDELLGFALAPGFREGLETVAATGVDPGMPVAILDRADRLAEHGEAVVTIELDEPVTDWIGQVEMEGLVPLRPAGKVVDMLVADLERWA
jgi:hypothetical protein